MRWFRSWRSREQDLDDEILAHLAIEVKQQVESGSTPEEAERRARRDFGNVAMVKEVTRSTWSPHWLESLAQDCRYALRGMRESPGFTLVAILTLALGIGANTAIFSVVDAAMLQPLPFPGADRLVRVLATKNGAPLGGPSAMDARDFENQSGSFEGIVVYDHWRKNVSGIAGSDAAEEMVVGLVPGRYFELLRVRPLVGRFFSERESEFGRHFVAVISNSFWRSRFAADPQIAGRTLRINGETYSIVGVIPDGIPRWMDGVSAPISIWTPYAFAETWTEDARGSRGDSSLARLKPGISYERARTELSTIADRLASTHPMDEGISATIEPLADTRAGPVRPVLLMLAAAVGLVLAIACANLAGLLLARNSARSREMAVRAALGAGRGRLARQLLAETLILSVAGGVFGLGLAWAAGIALTRMTTSASVPYASATHALMQFSSAAPEPRVLLFTFAISLFTAALFGLAPAFTGSRVSLIETLREGGRGGTAGGGKQRLRRVLVMAEVAFSLVLMVAAALLTQTIVRLQSRDPGFRSDHRLRAHLFIPPARYTDAAAITRFCDALTERVRNLPGVVDASIAAGFPPSIQWKQMFTIAGQPISRISQVPTTDFNVVDTGYFHMLGIPVVSGRDFADSDTATGLLVGIVNEEFARRYFPNQNPIGRQIRFGPPPGSRPVNITGVVRNFMNNGIALTVTPQIFTLFRQQPDVNYGFKDIVVRTAMIPEAVAPAMIRQLQSLDPDIPLGEIRTMDEALRDQISDTRFTTVLLSLFAALGTVLAIVGAYGVVAYLVAQRTQEVGVRVALGATSKDILWLVLRHGVAIGVAGVLVGIAGAMAARQLLAKLLYGVTASDPITLAGAAALLLVVIVAATAVPARRAMRIDPVEALRGE